MHQMDIITTEVHNMESYLASLDMRLNNARFVLSLRNSVEAEWEQEVLDLKHSLQCAQGDSALLAS